MCQRITDWPSAHSGAEAETDANGSGPCLVRRECLRLACVKGGAMGLILGEEEEVWK